ncbi:MAG: magnesium transporter [Flavobacteriales bacterium]|jgi:magnesium transporter|nr:magnesium transporter [Flavobacteriales bacterium]MBT4881601.1 magnesium transporter [Flavobacteriales bacterium]|tara:strand:+ start:20063 stop:21412 length:1350 start_codon:yes stop_codon:yes gene_type:complete
MSDRIEINSAYIEQITALIEANKSAELSVILSDLHIADIAEIIEDLQLDDAHFLFDLIEEEKSAAVLVELEDDTREELLSGLTPKEIAEEVIDNLESDDAADVIGELSEDKKEKVLAHIEDIEHASDISDLLTYPEDTAGGLMAKELIKVNENWNTLQCLKEMRKQAEDVKKVYTIYVVDDNNKLLGSLSLRRLLLAEKGSAIKSIVNTDIVSVKATEDDEDVANILNKYDLIALPVVDDLNRLIGRITFDDVMDVVKEEAEKDYQMASGISEDIESSDSVWELTRARLPWLLIGMIGGLLGAKVIGIFDLENNFELAFFIPLIAAMGGNVGVQSAAIVVQGLANDSLKMENIVQKLIKELGVGLLNGIICSIIILGAAFGLGYSIELSLTVSISLLAVIIFAALFGTFVPLTLERYKIDPALATGPFITTVNDVLGLFIYFMIGQAIL